MKPGGPITLPPIYRGCDWPAVILTWKDLAGNPIDITDFTPFAETSSGINLNPVKVTPASGVTNISLSKAQTAGLPLGPKDWDWVWWADQPTGTKYPPIIYGTVEVLEPRTHDF